LHKLYIFKDLLPHTF